jgi:alkanesulfonate monooxygenase SsuD/methylene tetrahydromethanopterin reductase-like flavin-dependent oxidoreductase (luciferase family)
MVSADVSIGVAGTLGSDLIARLAPVVERAGFHGLWVNDLPGGDALTGARAAASVTDRLLLGTGVVPIDRKDAAAILDDLDGLPERRLRIGIGSGGMRSPLAAMGEAVDALRTGSRAAIYLGALGPRMRRLGAERADGILLNWLTPSIAATQADEAHSIAPDARVALYVRTAVDADAAARLAGEARRYDGFPSYAANFARLGIRAIDATLDAGSFEASMPHYREAVDEIVLRAITPGDSLEDYTRFVERAAELLEGSADR